ncbi:MAG: MFS transporter [Chthoniobacteraceae bacterium]|nr:MFS transporter [Chthoniobacteraceae bacterium]
MKIPHLRWLIAVALLMAAVLNYIDRSVLGLLAQTIQNDLHISDQQYAVVINSFLVAYTVAYLLSGRVVDKLGVRLSLALFVGWWSLSNALTGLAQSVRSLSVFRFMLGLGEAGGFTASPKAISEWFPPSERGIAVGIYSVGGAVGATIAPILVAVIAVNYGWRWVFAVSPVAVGIWMVLWLWLYKKPSEHPYITEKERILLAANEIPAQAGGPVEEKLSERELWGRVFREPFVWQLMFARLLTDPVWYFYQFWMPKYLQSARGLDQKGVAIMWMIFLAADAGFLISGFLSGRLVKRGMAAPAARLRVMLPCACLVPLSFFVPAAPTVAVVIAIGMVVTFAHTAWLSTLTSLVIDIVPGRILGTAFGVIACGSTLGGIFMNQIVAWFIGHRSYDDCFYLMTILHPLALVLIWGLRKRGTPVSAAQLSSAAAR